MFGGVAAIARVVKSFFDSAANSRSRGMEVTQRMDGKTPDPQGFAEIRMKARMSRNRRLRRHPHGRRQR